MNRADFRHPETRRLYDAIQGLRNDLRDELVLVEVLPSLAELPAHAAPNRWFRVLAPANARANIYVGNGPTAPLSMYTTTPVA